MKRFANTINDLPAMRESRQEFLDKIDALPLKEGESIYFQWGAHVLPIFGLSHPLGLTYLDVPRLSHNVVRAFHPQLKIQSSVTYPVDRKSVAIRYLIVDKLWADNVEAGKPIILWDTPHPRMVLEPGDKKVLEWGNLEVIEKAVPISDAQ